MGAGLAATLFMIFCACPARADTIDDKAALCASCHGEKGVPQEKITPIIWGQSVGYLYLPALGALALASVLLAPLGARAAHAMDVSQLKRVFAALLYGLAGYMLFKAAAP